MLDDLWAAATRHRFLTSVGDGSISRDAFDRWLAQDAVFVADLLTFQARLLARAPRVAQPVLAGGCVALVDELAWFESMAARRRVALGPEPAPATQAYRDLLGRLDSAPYADAITALWVLERVYLLAWQTAGHALTAGPYAEFVAHWTDPGFAGYVDELGALAQSAGRDDLVAEVLTLEIAFWDMALA